MVTGSQWKRENKTFLILRRREEKKRQWYLSQCTLLETKQRGKSKQTGLFAVWTKGCMWQLCCRCVRNRERIRKERVTPRCTAVIFVKKMLHAWQKNVGRKENNGSCRKTWFLSSPRCLSFFPAKETLLTTVSPHKFHRWIAHFSLFSYREEGVFLFITGTGRVETDC